MYLFWCFWSLTMKRRRPAGLNTHCPRRNVKGGLEYVINWDAVLLWNGQELAVVSEVQITFLASRVWTNLSNPCPLCASEVVVGEGKNKRIKRQGDGGCQCKGYCGYKCKAVCNRDKECYWDAEAGACYSKESGFPGAPINVCRREWSGNRSS